jgi:ketosteroid isomerase-like protein
MKFVAVRMFGATVHPRKSFGFAADYAQIQSNLLAPKRAELRMNKTVVWKALLIFLSTILVATVSGSTDARSASPCSQLAYREFDFWAGGWDVFEVGSQTRIANARVDLILEGCVLHEDYQQSDGHKGQSFTIYDSARHVWHQSWVTNRGERLEIEGKLENGEMVLGGEDRTARSLVRGIWKPENGDVRETAVTSSDRGRSWKPWFDIVFRPRSDPPKDPPSSNDSDAIKDLDRRYQKAVQANDAATMDKLLADDFMLVTGSGKAYSKADLLAEARGGRIHYDQQDDENQTVRIWGDTAVITAKLTAKGSESGKPFGYQVWFSDTYVKTPSGWKYVFGQSSLPLK